ncbi:hypothetical protein A2Z53_00935 [Candidatus Giovannonibacteria bacterium RIFCSPHIGHO2_02_42_15]|uniref:Type IV secretion system protein VirB6 n=2 Tax=Candidatus Giovannoniibacteriota TaxID=1752738 RepID=A0A1F5VP07_9BACT|nr:MAG: VirB6 [Candidatus Giovannonibacteria bacterium GW2011_GWF2_42_19]OGF65154.1 MAG: hypothetical protein A2Z53_00935 [Candidatus Giovannonibacteria bacterium RIFCSPHIGHO2_02_42_15]
MISENFKKYVSLLLLISFLIPTVLSPVVAYAQGEGVQGTEAAKLKKKVDEKTGIWNCVTNTGECIAWTVAGIMYTLVVRPLGSFLSITGLFFNMAIGLSLDNANYTYQKIEALGTGWAFSRDVVNLFFIFMLLFIAISIILGIESYGSKQILVKLILIALLVNFSFLAAQSIIFISNAFATTIYNAQPDSEGLIGNKNGILARALGLKFQKNLSISVVNTFSPNRFFNNAPFNDVGNGITAVISVILIEIAGIVLILAAALVLTLAALLMISRMAGLWLLLMLAPFGFALMIFPATRSYASDWWQRLMKHAIFPAVFLFLFIISVNVLTGINGTFASIDKFKGITEFITLALVQVLISGILLFTALGVSTQLGIEGGKKAVDIAGKGRSMFKGWAGRTFVAAPAARFMNKVSDKIEEKRVTGAGFGPASLRSPRTWFGGLTNAAVRGAAEQTLRAGEWTQKRGGYQEEIKRYGERVRDIGDPTLKAQFISELPEHIRRAILDGMNARDLVAMHGSVSTDPKGQGIRNSIMATVAKLAPEKKDRIFEEQAKNMIAKKEGAVDVENMIKNISAADKQVELRERWAKEGLKDLKTFVVTLNDTATPDELKQAFVETASKENLQAVAKQFERKESFGPNSKQTLDFINYVESKRKDKTDMVLGIVPGYADRIPGKDRTKIIAKVNFEDLSIDHVNATPDLMKEIVHFAPQKSFYPIYNSEIFDPFVRGLKSLGTTATDIAGKLRSFGNNSMATYIETNEIAQQMLGLTHSGGGGGTDGATTGGTP